MAYPLPTPWEVVRATLSFCWRHLVVLWPLCFVNVPTVALRGLQFYVSTRLKQQPGETPWYLGMAALLLPAAMLAYGALAWSLASAYAFLAVEQQHSDGDGVSDGVRTLAHATLSRWKELFLCGSLFAWGVLWRSLLSALPYVIGLIIWAYDHHTPGSAVALVMLLTTTVGAVLYFVGGYAIATFLAPVVVVAGEDARESFKSSRRLTKGSRWWVVRVWLFLAGMTWAWMAVVSTVSWFTTHTLPVRATQPLNWVLMVGSWVLEPVGHVTVAFMYRPLVAKAADGSLTDLDRVLLARFAGAQEEEDAVE